MTDSNTDVIYGRFPFLWAIIPKGEVSSAKISRIDEGMLCQTPYLYDDHGSPFVIRKIFDLLDKDGKKIARVGEPAGPRKLTKPATWLQRRRHETVEQALERVGERVNDIHYIVDTFGTSEELPQLTLHLLPKGFTNIPDWRRQMRAQAGQELKRQLQ